MVGDCCTDHTEEVIREFNDSRIKFENLPIRGPYVEYENQDVLYSPLWMTKGIIPRNRALQLATGQFIAHLDDDDEFMLDKIKKLVEFAKQTRAALISHPFELSCGKTYLDGQLKRNHVTTSVLFYHHWLKSIPWDPQVHFLNEPADWNLARRMLELGVSTAHYPQVLVRKY